MLEASLVEGFAMRKLRFPILLAICALLTFQTQAQTSSPTDQLADKLVKTMLQVKPNQVVVITADPSNMKLVESLMTSLRKVGAFGIVDMGSNRMATLYFQQVPARFDSQPPKDLLTLASVANAFINIQYPADPSAVKGVSAERLNAVGKATLPYTDYVLKRSIPSINVGNGLMPSDVTASYFSVSEPQLATLFWNGVNADYTAIHRDGAALFNSATHARSVRIRSSNGTNLTFRALPSTGLINDGVVTAADRQKGGMAVQKQLPAGDVYLIPQPGTANGTLVFGPVNFNGVDVNGMAFVFKNGKVTSMQAKNGSAEVEKFYASGGAGRDELGWVDIGVNRSMTVPAGRWGPGPSMASGYITAGIGGNVVNGGTNRSIFGFASNVPNGTITIDTKMVVNAGRLASLL